MTRPRAPGDATDAAPPATIGPYRVLGPVGRGGMGVVYAVQRAGDDATYACKVVVAGADVPHRMIERFQREADALIKLDRHPNVVDVIDVGAEGNRHYIVMELVAGGDGDDLLARGPVGHRRAAEIAFAVARALSHAHRQGVIHRDIKPANVLIAPDGTPKVTDFGLARDLKRATRLTTPGMALGTPTYMSPEQARGSVVDVDELTDVYAAGALLYELLTGRPPFAGATSAQIILKVVTEVPPRPRRIDASIPEALEWICERAMEKDRGRRYASAAALAADLQAWLEGRPVQARPIGGIGRFWRAWRRHPAMLVLAGALLGGVLVGLWLLLVALLA